MKHFRWQPVPARAQRCWARTATSVKHFWMGNDAAWHRGTMWLGETGWGQMVVLYWSTVANSQRIWVDIVDCDADILILQLRRFCVRILEHMNRLCGACRTGVDGGVLWASCGRFTGAGWMWIGERGDRRARRQNRPDRRMWRDSTVAKSSNFEKSTIVWPCRKWSGPR